MDTLQQVIAVGCSVILLVDGDFASENVDIDALFPIQIPMQKDDEAMSELIIGEDGKILAQYGEYSETTPPTPIGTLALGLFANLRRPS